MKKNKRKLPIRNIHAVTGMLAGITEFLEAVKTWDDENVNRKNVLEILHETVNFLDELRQTPTFLKGPYFMEKKSTPLVVHRTDGPCYLKEKR